MGGAREALGDDTEDREPTGTSRPAEGRPVDRDGGPGQGDRSPDEQAKIDREAGDVADNLADFA